MAAPSPPLNDDDLRWLLVRTAGPIAPGSAAPQSAGTHRSTRSLVSQNIQPREPWLDVLPENVAMSGVIQRALLAQGLLLDAAVSPDGRD